MDAGLINALSPLRASKFIASYIARTFLYFLSLFFRLFLVGTFRMTLLIILCGSCAVSENVFLGAPNVRDKLPSLRIIIMMTKIMTKTDDPRTRNIAYFRTLYSL